MFDFQRLDDSVLNGVHPVKQFDNLGLEYEITALPLEAGTVVTAEFDFADAYGFSIENRLSISDRDVSKFTEVDVLHQFDKSAPCGRQGGL